jgi:hypothetical protein
MHRPVASRKRPLMVAKFKKVEMSISCRDDVQAEALFVLFKVASAPDGVDLLQQVPHVVQAMLHLTLTIASETTVDDLRINSLGKDVYMFEAHFHCLHSIVGNSLLLRKVGALLKVSELYPTELPTATANAATHLQALPNGD